MINMYIALDGTPEAAPENGYVWSWCPTQFYDPYDINEQYVNINKQLEIDPKAEGEAPETWTAHMKNCGTLIRNILFGKTIISLRSIRKTCLRTL